MKKILKVNKYCGEIDWTNEFVEGMNLLVAPTGSGKTSATMALAKNHQVGFVAPYVAVTHQVGKQYDIGVQVGMKEEEFVNTDQGTVTSYHSIPRMLEKEKMEYLFIDEIHVLVGFANFISKTIINTFWETVQKLIQKHPGLKVVCMTATPHFIKKHPMLNFKKEFYIRTKEPLSKPKQIRLVRSTKELLNSETKYLYLYPSRSMGKKQSNKYKGAYIDSSTKDKSAIYQNILNGEPPIITKIFTSTCLATGLSITNSDISIAITNWMNIVDIVQLSARVREGVDILYVGRSIPFFLRSGIDKPSMNFKGDFADDMKMVSDYEQWVSYELHQNYFDELMHDVLFQMIHVPEKEIDFDNILW